jgi:AcrR family transcriptional regulator
MRAAEHVLPVLPRGRHRLSRREVADSQRARILGAIVAEVAQHGYGRTSVAGVVARAGVSSKAFYEQFADKEACFLAAYDMGVGVLLEELRESLDGPDTSPLGRFERALDSYLGLLASEPAFARTFLIEVYGAGPIALQRRLDVQRRFADLLAESAGAGDDPHVRFVSAALIGAVIALVTDRVGSGAADELTALRDPLLDFAAGCLAAIPSDPAPVSA